MLAAMADLEEKRSGEFLFDRAYLTTTFGASRSVCCAWSRVSGSSPTAGTLS